MSTWAVTATGILLIPGQPLSVLASVYYATVTLSTTGYGDIVPVTDVAQLVNTVLITPIRVIFLILLVGTTLEVLTERTRRNWRIARWKTKVAGQVVVIGYGSKDRAVIRALSESGVQKAAIVVIDSSAEAVAEVNAAGLVGVGGDATRSEVLRQAQIGSADRVVLAVRRDDTAVLIVLTARQLNPSATIVAAVRRFERAVGRTTATVQACRPGIATAACTGRSPARAPPWPWPASVSAPPGRRHFSSPSRSLSCSASPGDSPSRAAWPTEPIHPPSNPDGAGRLRC